MESAGTRVQLFPASTFRSQDTRPTDVAPWRLEEPQRRRLIDAAQARQTPYCFDYEHQAIPMPGRTASPRRPPAGIRSWNGSRAWSCLQWMSNGPSVPVP
ncbi:MAG: phage protease [Sodalis sp. (in: enterobacteria)]|uniref:phage protease n=1 Tax=Sodalis sp. (in: enterobacteria) TaxID=1898979 RepID=UPI003F352B2C